MEWLIQFTMGAVLVVAYSGKRFNAPCTVRSLTTIKRYYLGLASYVLFQLLFYYVVSLALGTAARSGLLDFGVVLDEKSAASASPILAALLVMIVLPNIPLLRAADEWLRRKTRQIIGAPSQALRLGKILYAAEVRTPEDVADELWPMLKRRGLDPDRDWFLDASRLKARWLCASVLMHQLWRWERDGSHSTYAEFLERSRPDVRILRRRYDQICLKIARAIDTVSRIETMAGEVSHPGDCADFLDDVMEREVHDESLRLVRLALETRRSIVEDLMEDIEFFLKNLCGFVAKAVLNGEANDRRRERRLREIGFAIPSLPSMPFDSIVFAFFVFFCVLFLNFVLLGTSTDHNGLHNILLHVTMITTVQVLAIVIGGYPKLRYGFGNTDLLGHRPYGFFLAAGLVAALCAVPISIAFKTLIYGSLGGALTDFATRYPWLLMSFSTATTIAVLVQEGIWPPSVSPRRQRLYDGAVVAGIMVMALMLVRFLLELTGATHIPPPIVLFPGGVIGFLVGYAVPSAFRNESLSAQPRVVSPSGPMRLPPSALPSVKRPGQALAHFRRKRQSAGDTKVGDVALAEAGRQTASSA